MKIQNVLCAFFKTMNECDIFNDYVIKMQKVVIEHIFKCFEKEVFNYTNNNI